MGVICVDDLFVYIIHVIIISYRKYSHKFAYKMKKMNKNEWIAVVVGVALVAFLLYGGSFLSIFGGAVNLGGPEATNSGGNNQERDMAKIPESGVESEDLVVGSGATAQRGDAVSVHYVGTLTDGTVFDSSLQRNEPFTFTLGSGQVIRGWDEGLVGMQIGGVRRVYIAPDYAYGSQSVGSIPANSALIFEVQLLDVEKAQ